MRGRIVNQVPTAAHTALVWTLDAPSTYGTVHPLDEFRGVIGARLSEMERSHAWLARRIGLKDRRVLHNYLVGLRKMPERVRRDIEVVLSLAEKRAA